MSVRATAAINGAPQSAGPNIAYITGISIPDAAVTAELLSQYGGATPRLMTGVAMKESTYRQFAARKLYGFSARWPQESYDGGSHIGLMQVEVNQTHAWNWLANIKKGINVFREKLAAALRKENKIIAKHRGLRSLNATERENMALVLYGEFGFADQNKQYYIPIQNSQGTWDWAVNTDGNARGVRYVDNIRSLMR